MALSLIITITITTFINIMGQLDKDICIRSCWCRHHDASGWQNRSGYSIGILLFPLHQRRETSTNVGDGRQLDDSLCSRIRFITLCTRVYVVYDGDSLGISSRSECLGFLAGSVFCYLVISNGCFNDGLYYLHVRVPASKIDDCRKTRRS